MASISSLGDGGVLLEYDKVPVARPAGTNSYIFGKNILALTLPPIVLSTSFSVNGDTYNNRTVHITNGGANISVTLDSSVTPGASVTFIRGGVGTVTFAPGTGAVIRTSPTPAFIKIANQNSFVTAYHAGGGVWFLTGQLGI